MKKTHQHDDSDEPETKLEKGNRKRRLAQHVVDTLRQSGPMMPGGLAKLCGLSVPRLMPILRDGEGFVLKRHEDGRWSVNEWSLQ